MKAEHIAAYQKYFNRVKLDLGTTEASKLPTNERLKNFKNTVRSFFCYFILSIWKISY